MKRFSVCSFDTLPLHGLGARVLALALLASCSPSPRAALAPAPSQAECQAMELARLAKSGFLPGMNLDSLREAELDSTAVWFLEKRQADAETTERLDRAPKLLDPGSLQRRMNTYYPRTLKRQGVGGSAMLLFMSSPDSTPARIRVLRSSGSSELDLASARVIQEATVAPGIYHGCPTWLPIIMPVTWKSPWPQGMTGSPPG